LIQVLEQKAWEFDHDAKHDPKEIPVPEELKEKLAQMRREQLEQLQKTHSVFLRSYRKTA